MAPGRRSPSAAARTLLSLALALLAVGCLGRTDSLSGGGAKTTGAGDATAVPSGTVVAFAGREVPRGWTLCDGRPTSTGLPTPDLRGRFLMGADPSAADAGQSGGSSTHDHAAEVAPGRGARGAREGDVFSTSTSGHGHAATVLPAEALPPYVKLAFIMKD